LSAVRCEGETGLARRLAVLHPVILESPIAHSFLPFSVVPAVRERLAWREGADCDTADVQLFGVWLGRGGGGACSRWFEVEIGGC